MTPAELRSIIQHMVDRTCEAHIRLVIDRLDNILRMCERDGGLPRARELLSLYKNIYGEPLAPEPVITFLAKRPLDGRRKPQSPEHKAKIAEARANPGLSARNQEIVKLVNSGMPRAIVAQKFNITAPRVTQIYNAIRGKDMDS